MAEQWHKVAAEYDALARALEMPRYGSGPVRIQQQPTQQQQAELNADDN
jgi:hypothetical protein